MARFNGQKQGGKMHPMDIFVGRKIRALRIKTGFTQQQMAKELGISFQQVQKYEVADNRISISRLWDMAQVMRVSMTDFFSNSNFTSEIAALSEETLRIAQDIESIESKELRKHISNLVKTCADNYQQ